MELYKVHINHDPWMTPDLFYCKISIGPCASEWGKLLKLDLKGKPCRKWVNELEIKGSEKNLDPRGGSAPAPGHYTRI